MKKVFVILVYKGFFIFGGCMANIGEVYNYYETLVMKYIDALELTRTKDEDYLTDLYCLVLNQLPSFYIRYGVDMLYFTSDEKKQEMDDKVIYAVTSAIRWLDQAEHHRDNK